MPTETGTLRRTFRLLQAAALLLLAAAPAGARHYYSWEPRPERSFLVKAGVRRWQTASSAQVRSWAYTPSSWWTPPTEHISAGNTNDFKVMDAPLYLFYAEVQPLRGFSLGFETGDNRFDGGKYFEHDWLHATNTTLYLLNGVIWDSPQHRDYAKKTMETGGTARQYAAAAYLNVYRTDGLDRDGDFELAHSLDIFLGYSYYETRVKLFNGYKIMSTDFFLPTPPVGPMTGLDSRARLAWYGWTGGLREQASLGGNFSAEARFALGPYMRFRGENFWNLDTSLANPGVRSSATGILTSFELSLSYKFWKQFSLDGGWRADAYRAASGRETFYYADGSTLEGKLDRVQATRKGLFFGLSWKY